MNIKTNCLWKGVLLIILSALLSCSGQLLLKIFTSSKSIYTLAIGLGLYGFSALSMLLSFRYGELSIIHPMLSFGYIISILLGKIVLNEQISFYKILGIILIIIGVFFLCSSGKKRKT